MIDSFFKNMIALLILISALVPGVGLARPVDLSIPYSGPSSRMETSLAFEREETGSKSGTNGWVVVNELTRGNLESLLQQLNSGMKVFLVLGPDSDRKSIQSLLSLPEAPTVEHTPAALQQPQYAQSDSPRFGDSINWRSAPQLHCWLKLGQGDFQPLLENSNDGSALLLETPIGKGRLVAFSGCLSETENVEFQDWSYFNYFVHTALAHLNDTQPTPFATYAGAPIPGKLMRHGAPVLFGIGVLASLLLFLHVRRGSTRTLHLLDEQAHEVLNRKAESQNGQWSHAGFHRPLGGFLLALMGGLILFIPFVVFNNLVMPRFVLPSAQALGIWGRVIQFFGVFWLFFDWGTGTAFVKFLSEYRRSNPARAIQFGQVFVWWQLLTGTLQALIFVLLAVFVAPETAFALYAWTIIAHTLIQVPGFFQITRLALAGVQRYDYAQVVDIVGNMILPMIIQTPIVYLAYKWGVAHPHVGGAFAGVMGMAVSAYLLEAARFALGHYLFNKAGYRLRLFFMAHFDRSVLRECLRFGTFEMLGGLAWAGGQALEIRVTETHLANYTEVWGNWTLAQNFAVAFSVQAALFGNLLPSLSESTAAKLRTLSQYYQAQGYKWGAFVTAFLIAVLLVVAPRFILGSSGAQFARAAEWSIPTVLAALFLFPSWAGDHIALGSGKPWIKSLMVSVEQILRVVGLSLLIARFQVNALIIAYIFGFAAKAVGIYYLNHRICFPHRFYVWQSLVAPALAGVTHYLCLRGVAELIWTPTPLASIGLFFVGILLSFPLYIAFFSWFGGWDDDTLAELRDAADASGPVRPLSLLFWRISLQTAKLSPFHNRFPMDNRPQAIAEAATLDSNP